MLIKMERTMSCLKNNEYTKLITQYQYLQYNSLMDKKHVSTDLFSVKDGK